MSAVIRSDLAFKAYVSEVILNRHCLSLSLNADLCIHFYWLSKKSQKNYSKFSTKTKTMTMYAISKYLQILQPLGTIPLLCQQMNWVAGSEKWLFLLTFSTIYDDVGWVG